MYQKLATQTEAGSLALPCSASPWHCRPSRQPAGQPAIGPKQVGSWTVQGLKSATLHLHCKSRVVPNGPP